ncbi:MAG: MerR family transcriptional regulator [Desulfarculus sp.]|nr:MerR family transcriptional regulator [Desulfarculus sp.]
MDRPRLPEKPYFRICEVAELLGVETYVLRYWESEFPQLRPVRAPSVKEVLDELRELLKKLS